MSTWTVRWLFRGRTMTERHYAKEDVARRIFSAWELIDEWAVELSGPAGTERRERPAEQKPRL